MAKLRIFMLIAALATTACMVGCVVDDDYDTPDSDVDIDVDPPDDPDIIVTPPTTSTTTTTSGGETGGM